VRGVSASVQQVPCGGCVRKRGGRAWRASYPPFIRNGTASGTPRGQIELSDRHARVVVEHEWARGLEILDRCDWR